MNVVGVVVSPGSSHTLRLFMVWHHIVVIREGLVTNGADSVLFDDFAIQHFLISAGDRSSRYRRVWCGSSIRCTPILINLTLGTSSRPQQEIDLWIGHTSLRRSLISNFLLPALLKFCWTWKAFWVRRAMEPVAVTDCHTSVPGWTLGSPLKSVFSGSFRDWSELLLQVFL